MKKLFVLLLAVAMIAGCCTAALAEEELRGPIEIRFIYHSLIDTMESKGEDYQHNRITDAHRQNSGIDFVITPALVSGEEETARRAMILASGDVPDIMVLSVEEYMQFATQGLLTEVSGYLDSMPNYMALVPEEARDALRIDGELFAIPGSHEEVEMKGGNGILVRYDLYKELGLEKEPQTADEYYEMWKLVKEKYPDMYPFADNNFDAFKAAFGVLSNTAFDEEGKLVFTWATEDFREYLTYMHKLYAEGLMDPEYLNYNTATMQERWVSGAAFSGCRGWADPCVTINGVFDSVPGSELKYLPQLTKDAETPAELTEIFPTQRILAIPVGAENIDLAIEFIDYMATPEAKMIQDYGIEGIDYTLNEDGTVNQTLDEQNEVGWKIAYEFIPTPESFQIRLFLKGFDWAFYGLLDAREASNTTVVVDYTTFLPAYDEYLELSQTLGLKAYADEMADKFIIGERSLDEFDDYIAELEQRGLAELTDVLNEWYNMYN